MYQLPLEMYFTHGSVNNVSATLSIHPTLSFPPCVQKSVLCLHLHCCPADMHEIFDVLSFSFLLKSEF